MGLTVGAAGIVGAWLAAPRRVVPGFPDPLTRLRPIDSEPAASLAVAAPAAQPGSHVLPSIVLALIGVVALGAGWGGLRDARIDASLLARLPPGRIEITGVLRADPASRRSGGRRSSR
jgi:hypothetical protein